MTLHFHSGLISLKKDDFHSLDKLNCHSQYFAQPLMTVDSCCFWWQLKSEEETFVVKNLPRPSVVFAFGRPGGRPVGTRTFLGTCKHTKWVKPANTQQVNQRKWRKGQEAIQKLCQGYLFVLCFFHTWLVELSPIHLGIDEYRSHIFQDIQYSTYGIYPIYLTYPIYNICIYINLSWSRSILRPSINSHHPDEV